MQPLSDLDVLVVDCQTTAAAPRGHLLELGWALGPAPTGTRARLIALPAGERIPPAVERVTGITHAMLSQSVDADVALAELCADAAHLDRPAPAIAHFARFERPFLRAAPIDLVCTHEIACRLLPGLPRRSLRALAGYFGRSVSALRRSADHVDATMFVWREVVRLLGREGISTWAALREWLDRPTQSPRRRRRVWPMSRELRLALPDAPGVYRMLRTSGDVLYVGKAASLHHRVNSYFRKQHGVGERMLEMLSQARGVSFEVAPSALEAALIETDEIKRHQPPYNVALTLDERDVWFAPPDLSERSPHPSSRFRVGPLTSVRTLDEFDALARGRLADFGQAGPGVDPSLFEAAHARLCAAHADLFRPDLRPHARLLRLGTRLWQQGRRDHDVNRDDPRGPLFTWTPEYAQATLEWIVLRAALALRRAGWLTRLVDASVVWSEPGCPDARLIVLENGEIVMRGPVEPGSAPPVPPGYPRSVAERHHSFTIARFDRLRVLTTELKRLVSDDASVAVRFGPGPVLGGARLARALWWV